MDQESPSTLISRNIVVGAKRTSLRLEPAMWQSLQEIARREVVSIHRLCTEIDSRRHESSLTAAIRVFILSYFRAAATEQGHRSAGHGVVGLSSSTAPERRLRTG